MTDLQTAGPLEMSGLQFDAAIPEQHRSSSAIGCGRSDSNRRSSGCEPDEMTTSPLRRISGRSSGQRYFSRSAPNAIISRAKLRSMETPMMARDVKTATRRPPQTHAARSSGAKFFDQDFVSASISWKSGREGLT